MKRPTSRPNARTHRRTALAPSVATGLSILVIAVALILTIGGAIDLLGQVLAAPNVKAGVIALVLHLGLVLVGPALLLAYVNLMPRDRLPRALGTARIGAFAAHSQTDPRHH